jgi:RNA polymerase sigma-70 factor, ECF subfamily
MTYASGSASLTGSTNAATKVSRPLQVFRRRRREAQSASCNPGTHVSHNFAETQTEGMGIGAFNEMFVTSRPKFVAMAQAVLRNREDAEDAVQDAFLSAHLHLHSFEGRSALKTWFGRIVLNAAFMMRRKRKSSWSSLQETATFDDAGRMEIPTSQPNPEMDYAEQEMFQFVSEALEKMKPAFRQALTMTYHDELSGREACALLGVSTATFKSRLLRARRQLLNQAQRALLAPNMEQDWRPRCITPAAERRCPPRPNDGPHPTHSADAAGVLG